MDKKKYILNTLLSGVLFAVLLAALLVRVFSPAAVLPPLNIPNMVLISLICLVAEYYIAPGAKRCYVCIFLLAASAFGVLPLMAGFACQHTFWKLAFIGGAAFTLTTFLFTSITQRLRSGPKARAAAIISAFGIFLAAQCFAGILL